MAIDVRGFTNQYPEWGGLYKMADTLERRKLRQDQLALQQAGKRNAAGTFLQNYLDPKDYLSGTAYDPMIIQGLQEAMQSGAQLAAAGADSPTLMMALAPAVNRIAKYSTSAKTINKQVDDMIANMKADKQEGYNWAKLKEEALSNAFYKTDETGKAVLDPDKADPAVNWVMKTIQDNPEKVTTPEAFDLYARNAKMNKTLQDITDTDKMGNITRSKVNLTAQNYLQPVIEGGKVKDFVPYFQEATDQGEKLMHTFTDDKGNPVKAPVRLLREDIFDSLPPGMQDYIRGQVKLKLKDYEDLTGEKINFNSPKAKMVAQALAYDELNKPTRKSPGVEYVQTEKQSPQQTTLNVHMTDKYLQSERNIAAARSLGRQDVKPEKENIIGLLGGIMKGDPELTQGPIVNRGGRKVIDVTSVFPGGGLKSGRGTDVTYKGVYFDPKNRELVVDEEEEGPYNLKTNKTEVIKEADIGKFIYRIATANGIPYTDIRSMLDELGYKNGKFQNVNDVSPRIELEEREKAKSWRDVLKNPFGRK